MEEEFYWKMHSRSFMVLLKLGLIDTTSKDRVLFAGEPIKLSDSLPENELLEAVYDELKSKGRL